MLIKTLGLGGAERHVVDLSKALAARGEEVLVIYTMQTERNLVAELNEAGITVHLLDANGQIGRLRQLSNLLAAQRPEVVHAHSPALKILARALRARLKFRLVTTYHNVFLRHRLPIRLLERFLHRSDDVQVSCSDEVAASWPWATLSVPNGINLDPAGGDFEGTELREQFNFPEESIVFTTIASLLEKKNHKGMIAGFARATQDEPLLRLVLFGDGPLRDALQAQVKQLGVADAVVFAGADPEARRISAGADAFCLVSWHEGLPLALLEAMANGLPSVVSRAGAMPSVVRDGESGFVVEAAGTDEIASAIIRLASDPQLRHQMGRNAKKVVTAGYGLEQMVDRLQAVYRGQGG